jgi:hypothetical protein
MKSPYVFYTFVSDNYHNDVGTPQLVNSFKKFHPDIPLVIFREDVVSKIINRSSQMMAGSINWLNAKPVFAKFLTEKYDCVVNIDADTVILGRLDEVFTEDYDIGSVVNFNHFENVKCDGVTEEQYLQAGMVACRRPEFWDIWMQCSLKENWHLKCAENDTLNMVVYNQLLPQGWKLKVFDKEKDFYGCKLLGWEDKCVVEDGVVKCNGEQVKAYHAAKGPGNMPKLSPEKIASYGFNKDVQAYIAAAGNYGTSVIYDTI